MSNAWPMPYHLEKGPPGHAMPRGDRREPWPATGRCHTSYKDARHGRAGQTRDTRWEKPAAPRSRANAWFAGDASCRTSPTRPIAPRKRAAPQSDTTEKGDHAANVAGEKSLPGW